MKSSILDWLFDWKLPTFRVTTFSLKTYFLGSEAREVASLLAGGVAHTPCTT
jgi:hypothetical protein